MPKIRRIGTGEVKRTSKSGTTRKFQSKTTFRNWLRRNKYTRDAGTGVYNSRGQRIGAAYTRGNSMEVDFY